MKLFSLLARYSSHRAMGLAFFAAILGGIASVGFPALITSALTQKDLTQATWLGWAFLGVCIVVPATRLLSQYLLIRLAQDAAFNLRMQFSRQLASAPLRLQERIGAHRFLAAVSEDLPALTAALTMIPGLCVNIALVLGCLVYLGWLSWLLLLIVLALIVVGSIATQLPARLGRRRMEVVREEADSFFKHFRALTEGAKEVKVHRKRRLALLSRIQASAERLKEIGAAARMIFNVSASLGQLLFFFIMGLILFTMTGFQGRSHEVLIGFTVVLFFMKAPLQAILENLPDFSRAAVAMQTLDGLGLSLEVQGADFEPDSFTTPTHWETLELTGVTHTYLREDKDDTFTLGPIDLEFRPGELVFLVGGNGSGKTTLAKLLLGVYTPQSGEVRLDGKTVSSENRDRYRQLFSVVFSDFFLFDNLLGIDSSNLDEKSAHYLSKLHLDHKLKIQGGELSTVSLSQGQRKRLALLTAYMENRPIYLFDEWAADQDPVFKELFYLQLLPELKAAGKSVFVISHDDRYYSVADRVIKLESGKVEYDRSRDPLSGLELVAQTKVS